MKSGRKWNSILQSKWTFMAPSLAGTLIFAVLPFLEALRRSLWDERKNFFGVSNYREVWNNEAWRLAVKNTAKFVGVCIPLLLFLSLVLALALFNSQWMRLLKSALLLPLAVPTAVVVFVWKLIFYKQGLFNKLLGLFFLEPVDWLGGEAAFFVLVISYIWKNMGYTMVLWLAAMAAIPTEMLEAAKVDGSNGFQNICYMVLPSLKPAFYTITIVSFLNSFKVFREAYLVAGSYPPKSMYLLQHLFNNWFINLELGKISAVGVEMGIIFAGVTLVLQHMWDKES
ncbi:MAG: sugar ABC transporter permease [Roseburia sp.]|nr:sugar ABC transporter permease [Roseburia sp.]